MTAAADMDSASRDWIEDELLAQHGTQNQRERWEAGLLPEDELLALARRVLFDPFASFRRWKKLLAEDARHGRTCNGGTVSFATHQPKDLTGDEWTMYKKIATAVGIADLAVSGVLKQNRARATVGLVEHVGRCSVCSAEVFGRAVSIRIEWAGRPLSREYSLEVA